MLKHQLLHPEITAVLARAGHSSQVLIADGNYPASSTLGPHAQLISLNLAPGVVTVNQVLQVLVTAIPSRRLTPWECPWMIRIDWSMTRRCGICIDQLCKPPISGFR